MAELFRHLYTIHMSGEPTGSVIAGLCSSHTYYPNITRGGFKGAQHCRHSASTELTSERGWGSRARPTLTTFGNPTLLVLRQGLVAARTVEMAQSDISLAVHCPCRVVSESLALSL